jgi:hypothetical protein
MKDLCELYTIQSCTAFKDVINDRLEHEYLIWYNLPLIHEYSE